MIYSFLLSLSVVLCLLKQELGGDAMENSGDYKVPMRDRSKQSDRKDNNILQDMRRYSGVLSVYGDQQWFTMNAELSARGECGNTLAIYKKSSEDGKCSYHVTIDLNKVCGMLTPDTGKSEGIHLLMLFTTERRCHLVSALSSVERDNWAREISQMIGKGHTFPVVLPNQNSFGHKEAILYYNTVTKNLLVISKPSNKAVEKCSLLALLNMSDVKSFGSSHSKLVIQTKKSCGLGTSHFSFQTPMACRIVHLLQNKCEEECKCCCKPHPFSQMSNSQSESSSNGSSSESDDEVSIVKVEVHSRSLQRLPSTSSEVESPTRSGRKTPEPSFSNKIMKKAATMDNRTYSKPEVIDNKKDDTILNSFLFVSNKMNHFNSDGVLPRNGTIPRVKPTRPSMPEMENTYEEIKPRPQSKSSLYEEIPEDLKKVSSNSVSSAPPTPNGFRNSWGGQYQGKQQQSHETVQRTYSKTLHKSFSEDNKEYEAMSRQEQLAIRQNSFVPSDSHSQQQEEDSYVCMHSLTNRQSLGLKPVASDGQLSNKQISSIPMYINSKRSDSPITYVNLTDVSDIGSTGNLAYAEISSTLPIGSKSRSPSPSPIPTSYAEIDHNLTEALRVTSIQRQPLCRSQTLDTAEHKKAQNKRWLTKLTAKKA